MTETFAYVVVGILSAGNTLEVEASRGAPRQVEAAYARAAAAHGPIRRLSVDKKPGIHQRQRQSEARLVPKESLFLRSVHTRRGSVWKCHDMPWPCLPLIYRQPSALASARSPSTPAEEKQPRCASVHLGLPQLASIYSLFPAKGRHIRGMPWHVRTLPLLIELIKRTIFRSVRGVVNQGVPKFPRPTRN